MLLHQPPDQVRKLEKIRDSRNPTTVSNDHLRIRPDLVRPLRRYRVDGLSVALQQQPRAVPVVPLADADKLPAAERVEGVRHTHKTRTAVSRARSSF